MATAIFGTGKIHSLFIEGGRRTDNPESVVRFTARGPIQRSQITYDHDA
jgi:hypothetical protein